MDKVIRKSSPKNGKELDDLEKELNQQLLNKTVEESDNRSPFKAC
jgi:hypothetical protein